MSFSCWVCCCILSKFYIKPQHRSRRRQQLQVVSYRNSTSNHNLSLLYYKENRVVSYRNSTSNHNQPGDQHSGGRVVSYRNSTSNHNNPRYLPNKKNVVSYRNSTSNHNQLADRFAVPRLYLIEILHQTTTVGLAVVHYVRCILSKFYIKPQLCTCFGDLRFCCILSKFYIKPQPSVCSAITRLCCILSKFYIKPQPRNTFIDFVRRCILSKFYIKPQLAAREGATLIVLYLIEILHQTTTCLPIRSWNFSLYLIEILHQTTTVGPHID